MSGILAINGGDKCIANPFPITNNIGEEERKAVNEVIDSGILSGFIGKKGEHFLGGPKVKELEENFKEKFGVKHVVSVSSATSALETAIACLGIGYGDEVIVTPYSMSATATSILRNHAVPVFCDIEDVTYNLDPDKLEAKITKRTKAIMVANIFGGAAQLDKIIAIAKKHNLKVIEDNAQSPLAMYKGRLAGTIGDIGIFSFNFHKVIHCGEGGMLVTNDDEIALRAQLVRNHGEVVLDDYDQETINKNSTLLGTNYRMTELQAAVAIEQLKKLDFLTDKRVELGTYLTEKLSMIDGLELPKVEMGDRHVFYVYPIKYSKECFSNLSREKFIMAATAEGVPLSGGYVKPIYLLPIYQNAFEYTHIFGTANVNYTKGSCPVCEEMYYDKLIISDICRYPLTKSDIDMFINGIKKVIDNIGELI